MYSDSAIKARTQEWMKYFKDGKISELVDDLYSNDCKMLIATEPLVCGREGECVVLTIRIT